MGHQYGSPSLVINMVFWWQIQFLVAFYSLTYNFTYFLLIYFHLLVKYLIL